MEDRNEVLNQFKEGKIDKKNFFRNVVVVTLGETCFQHAERADYFFPLLFLGTMVDARGQVRLRGRPRAILPVAKGHLAWRESWLASMLNSGRRPPHDSLAR